jgi:Nucleoside 2-deoxyribosyltransferase/pfkB family carbohydrate kinase
VIVAGGTYEEICRDPERSDLIGSGPRAAIALRSVIGGELTLLTAIDADNLADAETLAGGAGISLEVHERTEPVGFVYATPLSAPLISGPRARVDQPIVVRGDLALVFGMLEAELEVDVKSLVFDPQQPKDLAPLDLRRLKAERRAIVANLAETQALSGFRIPEDAARCLRKMLAAEVVVTKAGARGALVTTAAGQEWVGSYPTEHVWPIGSGDVFAAGFAWAWGSESATPVEAARAGSSAAAHWCNSERLNLPASAFSTPPGEELEVKEQGRVYLAGPFFNTSERWLVALARESMRTLGGSVFSPLHDVGMGDDIARQDLEGLEDCSAVFAILDHCDPGTLFEVGWARSKNIPVIGFAESVDHEDGKMLRGSGVEMSSEFASCIYRAVWASMGAHLAR